MKKRSSYEGLQKNIRSLETPEIEAWENQYPDRRYVVHIEIPEFTCICPKTGLPDFAAISIEYIPAKLCVELKSLKEYLMFYRDIGIFHEHFANKLMDDFVHACRPRWAKMTTKFNPRGGIGTTVVREHRGR
ncbi:MAG TPA: NADPH-dependent 7-cyano-7-deazaguanine reductase QueF [Candidatus Omnitrophica bacterium]|nr:NADPH-dependent 7-cyano-7-deazaguanine reductase QueF [Candidatus Omnitrophota bacterium]